MTIKNPNTIHYWRWWTYSGFNPSGKKVRFKHQGYLCSHSFTKQKATRDKKKVTCKNCKMILKKEAHEK